MIKTEKTDGEESRKRVQLNERERERECVCVCGGVRALFVGKVLAAGCSETSVPI